MQKQNKNVDLQMYKGFHPCVGGSDSFIVPSTKRVSSGTWVEGFADIDASSENSVYTMIRAGKSNLFHMVYTESLSKV